MSKRARGSGCADQTVCLQPDNVREGCEVDPADTLDGSTAFR